MALSRYRKAKLKRLGRDMAMVLIAASIPAAISVYTVHVQFKNERGNRFAEIQHAHYQEVAASMAAFDAAFASCADSSLDYQLLDLSSQVTAQRALPADRELQLLTNLTQYVVRSVTNDIKVPPVGAVTITNIWEGSLASSNDFNNPSNIMVRMIVAERAETGTISRVVESHYVISKPVVVKPGERDSALQDAYNQKIYATRHALMAARPYFSKKVQDDIDKILIATVDPYCKVPKSAFSNEFNAAVLSDDLTALIDKVGTEQRAMINAQEYFESQPRLLREMAAELVLKDK